MNYCININNPLYRLEIAKLTKILGDSNAAMAALELNNGYSVDKAPNGKLSILFETIKGIITKQNPQISEEEINNITTRSKLLVYSDNFRLWFGDWINNPESASKVVDENGEPLIVYHVSNSLNRFTEFNRQEARNRSKWLYYFSDSLETAESYYDIDNSPVFNKLSSYNDILNYFEKYYPTAVNLVKNVSTLDEAIDLINVELTRIAGDESTRNGFFNNVHVNFEHFEKQSREDLRLAQEISSLLKYLTAAKNFRNSDYNNKKDWNTYTVFLNIKNPFVINAAGRNWDLLGYDLLRQYGGYEEDLYFGTKQNEDGLKIENYKDFRSQNDQRETLSLTYAVENPNQIKDALRNNGSFYTSNNIYLEHLSLDQNGSRDTWLESLLGIRGRKEILLEEFIENFSDKTAFKGLYDLLSIKHKTSRKHSVIEDTKVILDSPFYWLSNLDKKTELKALYNGRRAFYDAATNEIHINVDSLFNNGNADSVIWHELLHAMTVDRLQNQTNRKKFELILKDYLKANDYNKDIYTGENGLEEFVADIWSDVELIKLLLATKSTRKGFSSIWDLIKSWLMETFGVSPDNSLFAEASAEIDILLNLRVQDVSNKRFYDHLSSLDQDTKDLIALMLYQYTKEGLNLDIINLRIRAFLNNDKLEVNTVRKFVDIVLIRQAQLHILGKDFGIESYTPNGFFDWQTYLKDIDLRHDITEEDDLSVFPDIKNYTVDPAEIIVPKIYKTQFKLGNYDIADIDENFFKKVNPFYECSLKPSTNTENTNKVDVLVRTHTGNYNVVIKDDLSAPTAGLTRVEPRIEDGWRLSLSGQRMYLIPAGLTFEIYKDNKGTETLVFKQGEGVEKLVRKLISSTENLVSVQLFLDNVEPTEQWIDFAISNNNIKTNNHSLKNIKKLITENSTDSNKIREELNKLYKVSKRQYKDDLSSTLYNSFVKSLYLVSVRIPTQAFQSIMATKAVGLTNDDSNNVFVTRWQFWLQGSDLDIDKTYLMGVDVSSIGVFNHWSPLADYTTRTLADISDQLPVPNGFELVLPNDYWKSTENPMVIQSDLNYDGKINSIITHYLNLEENDNRKEERLKTLVDLLTYINKTQEFAIHPDLLKDGRVKSLIRLINKHNTHKVTGAEARNIIQRNILRASLDERNMKASYSPIDVVMDKFKDELKKIEDTASLERNLDDGGLSIARAQYNNSVGKKDVGIMANGLKAFFALTHYLNKYRKDPNIVDSNRYFLTKLSLGTGKDKYFSTISDIKFEETALAVLENAFHTFCPELFIDENGNPIIGPELTFSNDDASLLISSLVSLATDNAKELALAKMNASIELACMHLFLVVMGYNTEDVVKFTTSTAFSKVAAILNRSKFDSQNINVRDAIELAQKDVALGTDDEYQLKQIAFIYNCAQEMSAIAKIAAINQGVKVDELDSDKFLQNILNVIADQVSVLSGEDFKLTLNPDASGRFIITSIEELIRRTHNIDNPSVELIQKYADKLESVNSRNEQYRYIDGSLQINMLRYYRDPDYRQFIIDFYDIFKHNFNVLDCINNLAHFNKMLEAFVLAESTILQHSSRARAVLQEAKRSYQGNRVNNYISKQESDSEGNTWTRRIKLFDKVGFSDAIKRKASKFYDDYILSEWIKEFGLNFEITYEDEDGNIVELNLKTNQDIAKFANFVAYELIPILKEVYPKNTFLHYIKPDFKLIRKGSKELFLPRYVFNFDIDTLTTVQDQNKAFYINQGFNELSNYTLDDVGIKTTRGGNIKLGELLYLYDRLVSSSIGQSSLDRAFDLYLSKVSKDSIAHQIASIELEHDTGERPDIEFDPLLFTAFCYASLIRNKANGVMSYDYNKETKKSLEFSIKEKYLFNLDSVEEHKDTILKAEQFLDAIRNGSLVISNKDGIWSIWIKENPDIWFEFAASTNDFTIDQFIRDLARDGQKDALNNFLNQLTVIPKPSFKGHQTLKVYKTFQENMDRLGVQVEIINDPNAANGYVQDGVIYLNTKNSITSTPMHELLHLVFGVIKADNFDNFQRLMELVYTSKQIQNIYSELNRSEEYKNLMDLDKKEEAFCRAIELIINGKAQSEEVFTDGENDLYETISETLTPVIGKTFGINPPTELISFLNDSVGNLKGYNSTLFMPMRSDSTGYLDSKVKIIQSTKISKFIEKLVKDGILIETEC